MGQQSKWGYGGGKAGEVVYFARCKRGVKIGTSGQVLQRITALRSQNPGLEVMGFITGSYGTEAHLHRAFWGLHIIGDWFTPEDDLLDWIEANTVKSLEGLPHKVDLPPAPTWEEIEAQEAVRKALLKAQRRSKEVKLHSAVPSETYKALADLAAKQNRPMANVIREAIEAYLRQHGYTVSLEVNRGGARRRSGDGKDGGND